MHKGVAGHTFKRRAPGEAPSLGFRRPHSVFRVELKGSRVDFVDTNVNFVDSRVKVLGSRVKVLDMRVKVGASGCRFWPFRYHPGCFERHFGPFRSKKRSFEGSKGIERVSEVIKIWTDLVMRVPETGSKGVFLVFRSLREHFRGLSDHFRGPEMNNRSAVEVFRRLRKVSKGLKRYRKGSKGLSRVQKVFRGLKRYCENNIRTCRLG
jgi:hypothetical protein